MKVILTVISVNIISFLIVDSYNGYNGVKSLIVGGLETSINDVPYIVSISVLNYGHYCGGSIYKANIILTAAHCVIHVKPYQMYIRAGSDVREEGGIIVNITSEVTAAEFNFLTLDGDIAIIILKEKLTFSDKIKSIELYEEEPKVGEYARISGWGLTKYNDFDENGVAKLPKKLQSIEVPIFDWNTCIKCHVQKITNNMFCAGFSAGGKDACKMDSGGPLVLNNKLAGIISWGYKCGERNKPGVFGKVKNFVNWIKEVAAQNP